MATDKIHFTKENETLLMTLSGRATQSQWAHPILRDRWAEEAMRASRSRTATTSRMPPAWQWRGSITGLAYGSVAVRPSPASSFVAALCTHFDERHSSSCDVAKIDG
jgi:O-methyltransferase involved in polyketide biosynthesis